MTGSCWVLGGTNLAAGLVWDSLVLSARALSRAGQRGGEQDYHLCDSPRHQPLQGLALSPPMLTAQQSLLPHAAGDTIMWWVQQLIGMCPVLLSCCEEVDVGVKRMKALSPPLNQMAKQLLDRGEGLWVALAPSP